jgi:two-component system, response regulator YesN
MVDSDAIMKRVSLLFWRYLFYYVVVLLIPVASLFIFVQATIIERLKDNTIARYQTLLEQQALLVDNVLEGIDTLCHQLSGTPELRPFAYADDPYHAREVMQIIRRFKNTNSYLEDLSLHYRGDVYVYSSSGVMSVGHFLATHASDFPLALPEFQALLRSTGEKTFISTAATLAVVIPYPLRTNSPRRTFIVSFDLPRLANSVIDKRVTRVIVHGPDAQEFTLRPVDRSKPTPKGEDLQFHTTQSGWDYVFAIPSATVVDEISAIRNTFTVTVGITLLFGFALILMLAFRHYAPIRDLGRFIHQISGMDRTMKNELMEIRTNIQRIVEQDEKLRSQLEVSVPVLRETVVLHLLNGGAFDKQSLVRSGIKLEGKRMRVVLTYFAVRREQQSPRLETFREELEKVFAFEHEEVVIVIIDRRRLVVVLGYRAQKAPRFDAYIRDRKKMLAAHLPMNITLGISSEKSRIRQIGEAYIEAAAAVDYRIILGQDSLIYFDQMKETHSPDFAYPYELLGHFERAVSSRVVEHIRLQTDHIIKAVRAGSPPLFVARRLYYHVLNSLWAEFHGSIPSQDITNIPGIFVLERADTIEETMELMGELSERFLSYAQHQQDAPPDFVTEVKRHIDTDFRNPNLSLITLADRFDQSPNYLSAAFKKHTRTNLSDYVSGLRIEYAKKMLEESELSVSSIVAEIGYSDASSFIRKFKVNEGMTPGTYRKDRRNGGKL